MTEIGPNASAFLEKCGYRVQQISQWSGETELLNDMRLYGDNARDQLDILNKYFSVDLSSFPFDKYFPPEFEYGFQSLLWLFWNSRYARRKREYYSPISLSMIEKAITERKWIFD